MRGVAKVPFYLALSGISLVFLLPFYLVVVISLQSIKGLDLTPPSFYPAEEKTVSVTIQSGLVYWDGSSRWFRILASDDLINKTGPGAYYLQLKDPTHATELVKWISDADPAMNTSTKPNKILRWA